RVGETGGGRIDDEIEFAVQPLIALSRRARKTLCEGFGLRCRPVGDDDARRSSLEQGPDHALRSASRSEQEHVPEWVIEVLRQIAHQADAVGVVAEAGLENQRIDRLRAARSLAYRAAKPEGFLLERQCDVETLATRGAKALHCGEIGRAHV